MPFSAVKGADVVHLGTMAAFSLTTISANLDRFFATHQPAAKGENQESDPQIRDTSPNVPGEEGDREW